MSKESPRYASLRRGIVNGFGALFYMTCLFLWLWACLPYLPLLIDFSESMQSSDTTQVAQPIEVAISPLVAIVAGAIVAVAAIAASVYVIIKTPRTVAKAGHAAVKHVSEVATAHPKIQHLPAKRRKKFTTRFILSAKLALCVTPAIVCAASVATTPLALTYPVFAGAAGALCAIALLCLALQYASAKLLRVPSSLMW